MLLEYKVTSIIIIRISKKSQSRIMPFISANEEQLANTIRENDKPGKRTKSSLNWDFKTSKVLHRYYILP